MATPTITVLLPVYNALPYLKEAIPSILTQTCSDFELLIIDDGSTDGSKEVIQSFASQDGRIRTLFHPKNMGLITTLNQGLEEARGKYIARMDGDDVALPTRLATQLAFLESHPDVAACGTFAQIYGHKTVMKPFTGYRLNTQYWRPTPLLHPTVMMQTAIARDLTYSSEALHAEDYDLWLRMHRSGYKLANIPKVLLLYRVHSGNISTIYRTEQLMSSYHIFCEEFPQATVSFEDFRSLIADSYLYSPRKRWQLKHQLAKTLPKDPLWSFRDSLLYTLRWFSKRHANR